MHQYQIFWGRNTALPDDDTDLSERGVTAHCVVNVDIHDMVGVALEYFFHMRCHSADYIYI